MVNLTHYITNSKINIIRPNGWRLSPDNPDKPTKTIYNGNSAYSMFAQVVALSIRKPAAYYYSAG
jgi:hypothetical protein